MLQRKNTFSVSRFIYTHLQNLLYIKWWLIILRKLEASSVNLKDLWHRHWILIVSNEKASHRSHYLVLYSSQTFVCSDLLFCADDTNTQWYLISDHCLLCVIEFSPLSEAVTWQAFGDGDLFLVEQEGGVNCTKDAASAHREEGDMRRNDAELTEKGELEWYRAEWKTHVTKH